MVRIASTWFATLLAVLVWISAPGAEAQGRPGAAAAPARSAVGVWEGTVTFNDGDSTTTNWTLNPDGTFMAGDGIGGTWSQNGAGVVLRYNTDAAAVYTGTIDGNRIYGGFRNRFKRTGSFAWTAASGAGSAYVGSWSGTIQWASGIGGAAIWTLNADGTFSSNDGFSGTWAETANGITMTYESANAPVLVGTRNGNAVSGTATNVHGDRGAFSMTMQAAGGSLAGSWSGTIQWPGEETRPVVWILNPDGTMRTNYDEHGTWTQNGADVEMRYQSRSNFQVLRGRLQGSSITGSADDNAGDPGRFQMSR